MKPCLKHPNYDGKSSPDWNCRACRAIRKAANCKPTGRRYRSVQELIKGENIETWVHHGEVSELSKSVSENINTLDDLIKTCKIDTSIWQIERWICNKWESWEGKPVYQIKAWLRAKTYIAGAREEIEELKKLAKSHFQSRNTINSSISSRDAEDGNFMLEINIPDLHMGKLAWSEETGHSSYDSKIAEELFDDALSTLIERTVSYKFSEILLPLGNDLLHSDTKFGTTTAGTQLDTDSRYHKNFERVRNMSIRSIERLRNVARVKVILIPGNHDTLSVWHLGDSLECYYHDTGDVEIDNKPCTRKYHQFGQVMLMFTHGDKGKLKDYPLLMATEAPCIFGATTHREAHVGHTHQLRVQEIHGVRVRTLSALCSPDAWHAEYGFVGNKQAAEAFIWHKEEGLVGTAVYTI